MVSKISKGCLALLWVIAILPLKAQSLEHPVIWGTNEDKPAILSKIENYGWAASIVTKAKAVVDNKVNLHLSDPLAILNTIPAIPADDNLSESEAGSGNSQHTKVLTYASYAGMLYYITDEEKYAQFAADIIGYYIDVLAERTPENTTICGNTFYDPRSGYPHFAIAYDFIYNFLKNPTTKVFRKSAGTVIPFDTIRAQKAVHNIAMNALNESGGADNKYGQMVSNHPVLRAPGVLFNILCVEDDAERDRLFNVFWNIGTKEQNSFTKTLLPMFGEQGIWPESVSYSFMQNITLVLNLVDRLKPEMDVMADNMHILQGNFLFDNLRHPNRLFVRYGDSHRDIDKTEDLYRYTLNLSRRRGFTEYEQKAMISLRQAYDIKGGYNPIVPVSTYDNYRGFDQLFWGINIPDSIEGEINFQKPTVIVKHAGVALQRNYVKENNKEFGLCGIIGGAHYVHSHCTGITMELYGAGYIMAANAGLPETLAERRIPVHNGYFWRHAGNNTMIVNGETHGIQQGSWKSNSDLWMNTTVNIAAEPGHMEDPVSQKFSFATQLLNDRVNNDLQQRTLSTIRTSENSGYYFDMFRSKALDTNKFHDYIYHNLGDELHIFNSEGEEVSTSSTSRYQNDIGDTHKSPGWRFFEETRVTESLNERIHVRFDLYETDSYMNMYAPAGVEREYTRAIGPATREARGGYINKPTQVLAIRQEGEAWKKPYVHIFEPATSVSSSIVNVEHIFKGDTIVGAMVKSEIGLKTVKDYIFCMPESNSSVTLADEGISFTGRFAVVRYEQDLDTAFTTLYIGEGDSLAYGDFLLKANDERRAVAEKGGKPYLGRILLFKDLNNKEVIPKGSNLIIQALVGEEFTEVTLWGNDTINLGVKTEDPYTWSDHPLLINMQDESYTFTLIAKDAQGNTEMETIVIETPGQKPYTVDEIPHQVPGKIQFEDYDKGGENLGYFDKSAQDLSLYTYRDTDCVDLGRNGTIISSPEEGEWVEYTVNVEKTGYYLLRIRQRTIVSPGVQAFSVLLPNQGDTLLKNCQTLYTGRSDFYVDDMGELFLERGKRVLRFSFLNTGFDLDYFELEFIKPVNVKQISSEVNGITLYPNPAEEFFYIKLKGFEDAKLSIYGMDGRLVYSRFTRNNTVKIAPGNEFIPGVYIIKVSDENNKVCYDKLIFR